MALHTFKCNNLAPLHFKRLISALEISVLQDNSHSCTKTDSIKIWRSCQQLRGIAQSWLD